MERKDFGNFITKIAEAEVLFQGLTSCDKDEACKLILSFYRRCEKFLSPKSQHSLNFNNLLNNSPDADSSSCIIDEFYTPNLIAQSLLYEIVEKSVQFSEEKELVWPSHRLRERKPSTQRLQLSVIDYGTADDTDDCDSEVSYETRLTRKRKQTNPRRAVTTPIIPKLKKRKLSEPKIKKKEKPEEEKESVKPIKVTIVTRSKVLNVIGKDDKKRGRPSSRRQVYTCDKCEETFTHGQSIYMHCQNSHGDAPRSCISCRKEYYSEETFSVHKCEKMKKEKEGPYLCRICGDECKSKMLLKAHLKQHYNKRRYKAIKKDENDKSIRHFCRICSKGFVKKISLFRHYRRHAEGKFVCLKCGVFCENHEELSKHMEEHNKGAQFVCLKCGAQFHGCRQYEQHLDAHARHDCPTCGKTMPTHKALLKHCKDTHGHHLIPEEKVFYPCEHCDKKFSRPQMLEVHMRIHTGEKPIECHICKIFFRTNKALAKHKQTYSHTIKAGEKPTDRKFLCSECGKAYFRKHALQRHMRYHTGDKPHTCEYCGYKCREVNNLKRHMSLHFEGERNFVCEICGSSFHAKKTLEMHHAYKHSEERNFSCNECSLTFKAKNALVRHMKVHTGEKDHKCWCGTAFKRMYNLRRHLKAVHGTDDLLPPVRRVQTLDKETKQPVPKKQKQENFIQSRKLKKEIVNYIQKNFNMESSNISQNDHSYVSNTPKEMGYVPHQEETNQPLLSEQHPHLQQQQHTPVPVSPQHQHMLQRPPSPPLPHQQAPTDLRQPTPDLRHQAADLRQQLGDHLSPDELNSHRVRYNPSEPSMMYGSLPLMDRQSAHTQPGPGSHNMDPTSDPYMQMGSSSSFIPQAVAYSTILREYGSQFPFLQDSGGSSGGTYPNFVK